MDEKFQARRLENRFSTTTADIVLRVYSSMVRTVILDVCPDCHGISLDGGESERLFAPWRT